MSDKSEPKTTSAGAVVAQKTPYAVEVESGKKYWWFYCGQSSKQPFCDGSHKGTNFAPIGHANDKDGTMYICGCKATERVPLCDGSHGKL
ncbi:MAG: CDGSH iron-sulfur domain-containing protein [Rhodospirillaceae bacterium]|nr:CDGSH iron-sulfur domain-containing protein [Rhodospirillaceae bacterium]